MQVVIMHPIGIYSEHVTNSFSKKQRFARAQWQAGVCLAATYKSEFFRF